jgi:hypothetical protein
VLYRWVVTASVLAMMCIALYCFASMCLFCCVVVVVAVAVVIAVVVVVVVVAEAA